MLPITAEEESQFPTLQEAEEMSNQQIKFAHTNRVMPKADNPTWKAAPEDALPTESTSTPPTESTSKPPTEIDDELVQFVENESDDKVNTAPSQTYIGHKIPEEFLIKAGLIGNDTEDDAQVQPLYKLNADGTTRGMHFYVLLKKKLI